MLSLKSGLEMLFSRVTWSYLKYVAFSTLKYFNGPAAKSTLSLPPFTFKALKNVFFLSFAQRELIPSQAELWNFLAIALDLNS